MDYFLWTIFTKWNQLDPVNFPVGTKLELLQERFSAEFSAYNAPLSGKSLGRKPLVSHFLCGALKLKSASQVRFLAWDLAIVLEGLSLALFCYTQSGHWMCMSTEFPCGVKLVSFLCHFLGHLEEGPQHSSRE